MIPKVIHYCWFGGKPKPKLAEKCIQSWVKYMPDYTIKEWNESNFDLDLYPYAREAYDAKKYAFVTDVVRLYALVNEGGVYMDTDVEIIRPIDDILNHEAMSGFESSTQIQTGLMASREGHPLMRILLNWYNGKHFIMPDGSYDLTTNVETITNILINKGLKQNDTFQTIEGLTLYPHDYLCPKSWETGEIILTDNTFAIHHFSGSWLPQNNRTAKEKARIYLSNLFHYILKALRLEDLYLSHRRKDL